MYLNGCYIIYLDYYDIRVTWWCSWLRHCATSRKFAGLILDGVIGIFHWHNPSALWPRGGSGFNRNEYQEYFLGVKAADAKGWQPYNLHVPIVFKSGSFTLLKPSGPLQACTGIALPFTFTMTQLSTSCTEQHNKLMSSTFAESHSKYLSEEAVNEINYSLFVNKISVDYKQRSMQLTYRIPRLGEGHSFCNFCINQ
jgi:hypothetical protein